MNYTIVGLDEDPIEPVPARVEQFYDRQTRSWITMLVDDEGQQIGDAAFDGERTGAAASKAAFERQIGGSK